MGDANTYEIFHSPVHPVQHVQRTVVPVHHPPVSTVHHAPDAILAKAPRIHGYAYTSEVKHDAPVAVAHAAPVVAHAAPVVAHAAPVVGHAAPVVGHGYGLAAPIAAPVLGIGAGLAGGIGYGHGHVAKAPIVTGGHIVKVGAVPAEHPQVRSKSSELEKNNRLTVHSLANRLAATPLKPDEPTSPNKPTTELVTHTVLSTFQPSRPLLK